MLATLQELYPFRWAVLRWVDAVDGWEARERDGWFDTGLGRDLAAVVRQLRRTAVADAPHREPVPRAGDMDGEWIDGTNATMTSLRSKSAS
jgi:hypothetical protein